MRFLIYGATKAAGDGIGRSVASILIERGHDVRGLCRTPEKAALEKRFPMQAVDVSAPQGVEQIVDCIHDFDPDVIWSTCGFGSATALWAMPASDIEQMIDANVRNYVLFCKACGPSCVDGGPHLILTGSIAGIIGGEGAALYAGTKGFLVPFVRAQRMEYSQQGHRPKISILSLNAVRITGLEVVADAVEFIGKQSRSIELLII
jgi:short-subunit dehydrogenase